MRLLEVKVAQRLEFTPCPLAGPDTLQVVVGLRRQARRCEWHTVRLVAIFVAISVATANSDRPEDLVRLARNGHVTWNRARTTKAPSSARQTSCAPVLGRLPFAVEVLKHVLALAH